MSPIEASRACCSASSVVWLWSAAANCSSARICSPMSRTWSLSSRRRSAQAVELAAGLDGLGDGNRGVERRAAAPRGPRRGRHIRAISEQADVDALGQERARSIESGRALGLRGP